MKRYLFGLMFVLAAIVLFGFAGSAPAEDGEPFRLTGTVTDTELLGFTEDTFTTRITLSGEGTIGSYEEISTVFFAYVGGTTWAFEAETTIYLMNDKGKRTRHEIYIVSSGTYSAAGNQGSFRIIGGTGLYEGASGSGSFKFQNPTATYNGAIH